MPLSPRDLAACLLDAGAVRLQPLDPFTWASGLKAPIYCDNRQLLGFPEARGQIVEALAARTAAFATSRHTSVSRPSRSRSTPSFRLETTGRPASPSRTFR